MKNDKFFKIANKYQDAKCKIRIPGQAGQVLDVIERHTFGWNKKEATISFRSFRKMTGMDNRHIMRARKKLIKMGIISVANKGNKKFVYYRIQMDCTKWKPLPKKATKKSLPIKATKVVAHKGNKSLPIKATTNRPLKTFFKDILFKDRKQYKIEKLKLRRKELQDDLKEKGPFESKEYLIEGIKEIDKELKKLGC